MARTSPFKFLQEVRTEVGKVTWPSRRETLITTAMVFVMVAVASIFFLLADQVIRIAVAFVLDERNRECGTRAGWDRREAVRLSVSAGIPQAFPCPE
jgi:preprotein translocase subunit SecE